MHCTKFMPFVILIAIYFLACDQVEAIQTIEECATKMLSHQTQVYVDMKNECDLILQHFNDSKKKKLHMAALKKLFDKKAVPLEKKDVDIIQGGNPTKAQIDGVKKSIDGFVNCNTTAEADSKHKKRIDQALTNFDDFHAYFAEPERIDKQTWEVMKQAYIDSGLVSLPPATLTAIEDEVEKGLTARTITALKMVFPNIRRMIASKSC